MVMVACKTLQRHLHGFIRRRLKEMRRRNTIWPRCIRIMTAYYSTIERLIVGTDLQPSTGIAAQKAGWGSCLNLEKAWRKAGCRRISAKCGRHPDVEIVLIESGGDNLSATFSPELADVTVYVIDVGAGEEVPRKGGPAIMKSDVLVIN